MALKSNLFVGAINWEYEKVNNSALGEFMIFCNCKRTDFGIAYVAHLRANDGVDVEEIERILKIEEE